MQTGKSVDSGPGWLLIIFFGVIGFMAYQGGDSWLLGICGVCALLTFVLPHLRGE